MAQLLFAEPRFRSPMAVAGMIEKRGFIKHFKVSGELRLPPFEHDCVLTRICGLGQDIGFEHALRVVLVENDGMPIGGEQKTKDKQLFECPQFLLNERRLNVETKIEPGLLVSRTDALKLTMDVPMLVWLFGVYDVRHERDLKEEEEETRIRQERDRWMADRSARNFPNPGETI